MTAIAPSTALTNTAVAISAARDNKEAVIARAQQIVEILGNRFVCEGWREHFDQQRAAEFARTIVAYPVRTGTLGIRSGRTHA